MSLCCFCFWLFRFVCSDLQLHPVLVSGFPHFWISSGCPICCKPSVPPHRHLFHLRKESLAKTSDLEEFTEVTPCWWLKSKKPPRMMIIPIIYRVSIHPRWLAGFLPSTVWSWMLIDVFWSHHSSIWAKVFIAHGSSGWYQGLKGASSCSPGYCRWQAGCSKNHWKHRAACRRIINADRQFQTISERKNREKRDFQKKQSNQWISRVQSYQILSFLPTAHLSRCFQN